MEEQPWPAGQLHNFMNKFKLIPEYVVLATKSERDRTKTLMRVTCPIVPEGLVLSADSFYCNTRREAKHQAAVHFMQMYMNYFNNDPVADLPPCPTCEINIDPIRIHTVLQTLCLMNNLGLPNYTYSYPLNSMDSCKIKAVCQLSYVCIEGQGNSKAKARLEAAKKFLQILMRAAGIDEIFESTGNPKSTNSSEIFCLCDKLEGFPLLSAPISIYGKRRLVVELGKVSPAESVLAIEEPSSVGKEPAATENSPSSTNSQMEVARTVNTNKRVPCLVQKESNVTVSYKQPRTKIKDSSMNESVDSIDSLLKSFNADKSQGTLTRLRLISNINRALHDVEKYLRKQVQDAMVLSNLPNDTIVVPTHEYLVFTEGTDDLKIFENGNHCIDQSSKISCLVKLLMDMGESVKK